MPLRYTELEEEIQNASLSYLPGLLACVLVTCVRKGVFKDEALMRFARRVERDTLDRLQSEKRAAYLAAQRSNEPPPNSPTG